MPPIGAVDLAGRTALVTGAAGGIGAACVHHLAAAGAAVIALDKDPAALEQLRGQVDCRPLELDLTDGDAFRRIPAPVDILVNNAGYQHLSPVDTFPPDTFSAMVDLMLIAPFRLIQAVLPGMYERGWGRIINVTSAHGHRASPFKAAYVSAKHGLEGLSKVVALEAGPRGVTSNCVSPGYVRTPLVERQVAAQAVAHAMPEADVLEQVFLRQSAVPRLIEPDEVAGIVAFLCSDTAAYITGTSLHVDGGWTAR